MRKPRVQSAVNAPLPALISALNSLPPIVPVDYAYLRDEWRCRLVEPAAERFAEWFDYALTLPQVKRAVECTYFECGMLSRTLIRVHQPIDIKLEPETEEKADGIAVPWEA